MSKKLLLSISFCIFCMMPAALLAEITWETSQINESGFANTANESATIFKHHGKLFALAANASGMELWRWKKSQDSWQQVSNVDLVEDANNIEVSDISVFKGKIYIALHNSITGVEIWAASLGTGQADIMKNNRNRRYNWEQVNIDGFGDATNIKVTNFYKYQDTLYVATAGNEGASLAGIWSTTDGATWVQKGEAGLGNNISEITAARVYKWLDETYYVIGTLDGKVYVSTDCETWTLAEEFDDAITSMIVFQKYLIVAVENTTEGAEVYATNDLETYTQAADNGFGNSNNTSVNFMRKDKKYQTLIVSTNNEEEGGELWSASVLENDAWQNLYTAGIDNANNIAFHDYIWYRGHQYLSTINAVDGVEVFEII